MPLKLQKRKGSPFWQIVGSVGGIRVRESAGTDDKKEADRRRVEIEVRLKSASPATSDRKTVAHAIVEYIEHGGDGRYLWRITETLGAEYLDSLDQEKIDRAARQSFSAGYRKNPKAKKVNQHSLATIKRQFYTPLAAVLNRAVEIRWMYYLPIKMPQPVRPPPQWAELEWFEKLWPHCSPRLKALTTFLPFTGCRIGECLRLEWEDLSLEEGWAYIRKTKNTEARTVHLTGVVIDALRGIVLDPAAGKVFGYKDHQQVNRRIATACKKAGIKYMSNHKIGSHSYATLMRRYAGMDAHGLQATGRWKDRRSVEWYVHTTASEEAKKVDIMAQKLAQLRDNGDKSDT